MRVFSVQEGWSSLCCPSAIRLCRNLKKRLICICHAGLDPASSRGKYWKKWIPGQARNDKNSNILSLANYDTDCILLADKCFSSDFSRPFSMRIHSFLTAAFTAECSGVQRSEFRKKSWCLAFASPWTLNHLIPLKAGNTQNAIPNRNCLTHLVKQSACKELGVVI